MNKEQRFAETLELLRERFLARTNDQSRRIRELYETVLAGNASADVTDELIRICHSVHGAAGVFGFPEVGTAAGRVEELLRSRLSGKGQHLHTDAALDEAIDQLLVLLATGVANSSSTSEE